MALLDGGRGQLVLGLGLALRHVDEAPEGRLLTEPLPGRAVEAALRQARLVRERREGRLLIAIADPSDVLMRDAGRRMNGLAYDPADQARVVDLLDIGKLLDRKRKRGLRMVGVVSATPNVGSEHSTRSAIPSFHRQPKQTLARSSHPLCGK